MSDSKQIDCETHGPAFKTYVCEHLASDPKQEWFAREPEEGNPWPDAWCGACDEQFMREGQWTDQNHCKIVLLCHHCYETKRSMGTPWDSEDRGISPQ
jgi:hypothetical protein